MLTAYTEAHMSKGLVETLARLEAKVDAVDERRRGQAELQETQAEQGRFVLEGTQAVLRLLEPKPKDGPSLDELLGYIVGQLTEVTGHAREQIRIVTRMEGSLPGGRGSIPGLTRSARDQPGRTERGCPWQGADVGQGRAPVSSRSTDPHVHARVIIGSEVRIDAAQEAPTDRNALGSAWNTSQEGKGA